MKLLDRAANVARNAMAAVNGLTPSTLYRGGFGLGDYSYNIDARNAYMELSSVMGCVGAYAKNVPQVRNIVQRPDGTPWPDHPLQWIIRHPNGDMGEKRLALYNSIYKPLGGASRLLLYRNSSDQIIGWRPYSTVEMSPSPVVDRKITRDSWIDYYWHRPISGAPEKVDRRNVLNLTFHTVHPLTPQMDMSPIAAAFLDINADKEFVKLPLDLMRKGSFMSMIFALGNGSENLPDDAYELIKGDLEQGWSGDNKFKPALIRAGGSASWGGPNFRNSDFSKLVSNTEARICIALDVPIRYMGFIAGLDASTSDNFVASWLAFVKGPVTIQAQFDAEAMTHAFTQEDNWKNHPVAILHGLDRNATNEFVIVPDFSEVEALRTELIAKHTDARANWQAGGTTRNEFRTEIGKPQLEGDLAEFGEEFNLGGVTPTGENEAIGETRTESVMKTPKPKQ